MAMKNETRTRRQMIGGSTVLLGGLTLVSANAQSAKSATTIHQEVDLRASPSQIYELLLDSKQFSAFTKDSAEIHREAGGAFKLFGGRVEGRNIELAPNQRIVQAWRPASWAPGVYSIARFELKAQGAGTRLVLDHTGFAEGLRETLDEGWHEHYWEPMQKYLRQ